MRCSSGARRGARSANGAGAGQGDPAVERRAGAQEARQLMSYEDLYALWERQNWRAHEIDFIGGQAAVARDARRSARSTRCGRSASFYIGEERVAADLAPFVLGGAERRGRDLPRHAARRRGPPRGVLRPLHGGGDGARVRRHPRPAARDGGADAPGLAHGVRRPAARHRAADPGAARRPGPVRGGHRHLPRGDRGSAGDDGAALHPQVPATTTRSTRASGRGSRWSSRTSTATSRSACASWRMRASASRATGS